LGGLVRPVPDAGAHRRPGGSDYQGRAKVVKLNVDDNAETSARFNIRGIPTLLLFKNGELKEQIVGAASKDHIQRLIDAQL
jgi:thioredoxin 1